MSTTTLANGHDYLVLFIYYFVGNIYFSFPQLHEVVNLCFEENVEKQLGASYIRRLLEEAWCAEGMWDTYL